MTTNQRNILRNLVLVNLVVYGILGLWQFGGSLVDQGLDRVHSIAVGIQQASKPAIPTVSPTRAPTAAASVPKPTSPPPRRAIPLPTVAARQPIPARAPQPVPVVQEGFSPTNPMMPADTWRIIAAGERVWYRVGSGGEHIDVFLEAKPLDGLSLEVYAPGQLDQPIGHGTLQAATNRLVWAGGHWQSEGDWLGRVTNGSSLPVQYKLASSGRDISNKSCYSYWENIGTSPVYWTKCE